MILAVSHRRQTSGIDSGNILKKLHRGNRAPGRKFPVAAKTTAATFERNIVSMADHMDRTIRIVFQSRRNILKDVLALILQLRLAQIEQDFIQDIDG